jgi:hypothetical protein
MTALSSIYDPARWRQRAEEARRDAEQIDERSTKRALMEVAAEYERLVAILEKRAALFRAKRPE